jgi:lysyl-tRNA synthetase class II
MSRITSRANRGREETMRIIAATLLSLALGMSAAAAQSASPADPAAGLVNDYPTVARADYVFACMAANGQSRQALEKCSCSIDTIATILPYDKYVEAETILSVGQVAGQQAEVFRSTGMFRDMVADLRRAQAEAEVTCFY